MAALVRSVVSTAKGPSFSRLPQPARRRGKLDIRATFLTEAVSRDPSVDRLLNDPLKNRVKLEA
jgi:hypothetical protein